MHTLFSLIQGLHEYLYFSDVYVVHCHETERKIMGIHENCNFEIILEFSSTE